MKIRLVCQKQSSARFNMYSRCTAFTCVYATLCSSLLGILNPQRMSKHFVFELFDWQFSKNIASKPQITIYKNTCFSNLWALFPNMESKWFLQTPVHPKFSEN